MTIKKEREEENGDPYCDVQSAHAPDRVRQQRQTAVAQSVVIIQIVTKSSILCVANNVIRSISERVL